MGFWELYLLGWVLLVVGFFAWYQVGYCRMLDRSIKDMRALREYLRRRG